MAGHHWAAKPMTTDREPINTMQPTDLALYPAAIGSHESRSVYGHLIGNQWLAGGRSPLPVSAPATGQPLAWLARGGAAEIDAAVAAAAAALKGDWGRTTATERGRLMLKFSALVTSHLERLAWIEAHDTGKPISQARADMRAVARYFEF